MAAGYLVMLLGVSMLDVLSLPNAIFAKLRSIGIEAAIPAFAGVGRFWWFML